MNYVSVRRHLEKAHGRLNEGPKKRKPPVMAVAPQDHAELQAGSLLPQQVRVSLSFLIHLPLFFNACLFLTGLSLIPDLNSMAHNNGSTKM